MRRVIYYPSCEGSPGLAMSLKEGHSAVQPDPPCVSPLGSQCLFPRTGPSDLGVGIALPPHPEGCAVPLGSLMGPGLCKESPLQLSSN